MLINRVTNWAKGCLTSFKQKFTYFPTANENYFVCSISFRRIDDVVRTVERCTQNCSMFGPNDSILYELRRAIGDISFFLFQVK